MVDKFNYKKSIKGYNTNSERVLPSQVLFENQIWAGKEDENTPWLTTKKASAYLGISPNALRIRVHRGEVEAHKFCAHLRFTPMALRSLFIKKEV